MTGAHTADGYGLAEWGVSPRGLDNRQLTLTSRPETATEQKNLQY